MFKTLICVLNKFIRLPDIKKKNNNNNKKTQRLEKSAKNLFKTK